MQHKGNGGGIGAAMAFAIFCLTFVAIAMVVIAP